MQQLIITLALLFTSYLFGQSPGNLAIKNGKTVTVTVVNALSDKGEVRFTFYNRANFLKEPMYAKSAAIQKGKSTVVFENVPAGIYAVICFHDENSNKLMDFYENGMPKESYGATNNDMSFGPPEFEASKFEMQEKNLSFEIKF